MNETEFPYLQMLGYFREKQRCIYQGYIKLASNLWGYWEVFGDWIQFKGCSMQGSKKFFVY